MVTKKTNGPSAPRRGSGSARSKQGAEPTPTLTRRALNRATLARQILLARETITPVRAVERLAGLQAQWPKPPFIGLWTRIEGFQRGDLTQALLSRALVRATMMRATLHLVSAKDYVSLRPVIQPVLRRGMQAVLRDRMEGLDVDRLVAEARAYFQEEPRTFTELRDFLMGLHPKGDERAMGFVVRMLLPLIQVPTDAPWGFPGTADFAVAESWLGESLPTGDADPGPLVLRYLSAFGPATVADAQAWSGLGGLRGTFDALRPKLCVFQDERGKELFDLPDAPRPPEDAAAPVRFLPEFDNLIVSRADARFVAEPHRPRVFLSALRVRSTFLVDGFVAGAWAIARAKSSATLVIEPFEALSKKARDEVAAEGERLIRFVESDARAFELRFEKPG